LEDEDAQLNSALRTPLAREDQNPTLQARGRDYDGGESSYGYGTFGNGLGGEGPSQMSVMTEDIKSALARSGKYDNSPAPSIRTRSRANSGAGSIVTLGSRRSSGAGVGGDELSMANLNLGDEDCVLASRRDSEPGRRISLGSEGDEEVKGWGMDPGDLRTIRRLGEGTGGAVELVQDMRSGRIMAKKVSKAAGRKVHELTSQPVPTPVSQSTLYRVHFDVTRSPNLSLSPDTRILLSYRLSQGQPTQQCTNNYFAN